VEAQGFAGDYKSLVKAGAEVFGISPDPAARHDRFVDKECLPFMLLSDEDRKVAEKYRVLKEKNMYGRKVMGIARTTFVIDRAGKVAKVFENVKPPGHSKEVLAWIEADL
jgi:peroxiredoxin Q/BCP